MPFDPKLVNEDDASFEGDLKLPDDLALMAEQLGDDAARLVATYPPPLPAVLAAVSRQEKAAQTRRTSWLARSLAGTALAAGLVTISLVASNSYTGVTGERPASAGRSRGDGEKGDMDVQHHQPAYAGRSPVMAEFPAPKSIQPQKIPVTPASWLGDTSGPELEALMDLWEQDRPAVRSLSF